MRILVVQATFRDIYKQTHLQAFGDGEVEGKRKSRKTSVVKPRLPLIPVKGNPKDVTASRLR